MVDGILERMKEVMGAKTKVIATGGRPASSAASRHIETVDEYLTLKVSASSGNGTNPARKNAAAAARRKNLYVTPQDLTTT
jgi:hypothetical protein